MNNLSLRCIKAAFASLALGITLGVIFAFDRSLGPFWRPLHAELNLWGWATLLIYGMAYHMLPRFAGRPLRSPRLAEWQSWLAITGVALVSIGWVGHFAQWPALAFWLAVGGLLQFAAVVLFVFLISDLLRAGVS
jgi:hypothetical protein